MKRSAAIGRPIVSADGTGVVSHAGAELLRELARGTGLVDAWDAALIGTYKAAPIHAPGQVLADLAVAIADGATHIAHLEALRDQPALFGSVASDPTAWRVLDRVSEDHLCALRAGRAAARTAAWAAGAGPDLGRELYLDLDATVLIAHSEKEDARPTWKHTFGFHPLVCYLDRPEIASGEALAGIVRPGNAGSNTAADHVTVLDMALASLPEAARPRPGDPDGPRLVVRADAAGATHAFAAHCRAVGVGFSMGFAITEAVREAIVKVDRCCWAPAIEPGDELRDGAWVTELTGLVDLSAWPEGSRLVVRAERPHPGAQLSLFDIAEGLRHTAFITDAGMGIIPGQVAGLELRQRQHARIEDRIRQAKAAGLRNLPCRAAPENHAWLECVLAAADLVAWSKLICFAEDPALACCEIDTFRYRILHMAARICRGGRVLRLRLDATWRWAEALALGFVRLRTAFG
ncbi:MAG: IS1380 family transposase [Streptosporangiaceae bacterium]